MALFPLFSKFTEAQKNHNDDPNKESEVVIADDELVNIYSNALEVIEDNDDEELSFILNQYDLSQLFDTDSLGSLLLRACETNASLKMVQALMECGPNVNYSSIDQSSSSLMMATKNDNHEHLSLLIENGAKVNATDKFGWTALFYASYFGKPECAVSLLEHGAQVNLLDNDGMSCLIWASGRGHSSMVELLIDYGALSNVSDRYNTSALLWASRKGNAKIVDILLKNGARVNERGMYGWTPLIVAVRGNHLETTKLLLEYEADVNVCDGEKMTPLMIGCKDGFKDIVVELIKNGAYVNQSDREGNTPLIYAAKAKSADIVRALMAAGAIAEQPGLDERNAFHWSIVRNDMESCRLFLKFGIDTSSTTSTGDTYLLLAAKHRNWGIIKLLQEHSGITQTPILHAAHTFVAPDDEPQYLRVPTPDEIVGLSEVGGSGRKGKRELPAHVWLPPPPSPLARHHKN